MEELITWLLDQYVMDEILLLRAESVGEHSPIPYAQLLADVKAKQAVVDQYAASVRRIGEGLSRDLERVIRALAQPYAAREGWREEWRAPGP